MESLLPKLRRVRRRMIARTMIWHAFKGMAWGGGAACILLLSARLFVVLGDPLIPSLTLLALGAVAGATWGWFGRPSLSDAALAADERLGLKERLTSALALTDSNVPMVSALHADAERHAASIQPRRDFPLGPFPVLRWTALPLIVFGVGYLALPEFDLFGYGERQAQARLESAQRQETAERLEAAVEPLDKPGQRESNEDLEEVAESVKRIAEELKAGDISEKEALAKVMDLSQQIEQRAKELGDQMPAPKVAGDIRKLDRTQELAKALQEGKFDKAAQSLENLRKAAEEGELSQGDAKKLSNELDELSEMAGGQSSELGKRLAKVADTLEELGESGDSEGMDTSQLQELVDSFQQAQMSIEDMESVAQQMAQMESAMKAMGEWSQGLGGEGDGQGQYAGMLGNWREGASDQAGPGMGREGRGAGGQVGELPDVDGQFTPRMLGGDMTPGDLLASIEQETPPGEEGSESRVQYLEQALVQVQKEAEQALSQEEIPAGSKELVRQYFGMTGQGDATGR